MLASGSVYGKNIVISFIAVALCTFATAIAAEEPTSDKLKLFLSCSACDFDYVREELHMVDYVRDRKQADIHVLSSQQSTASGGTEYSLEFIGRNKFDGMADTIVYVAQESDTDDVIRRALLEILKKGLVRYIARTPDTEYLTVTYTEPDSTSETADDIDPWNNWVFDVDLNGYFNGQSSYKSYYIRLYTSVNRVTEDWKIHFYNSLSYDEDRYEYAGYKSTSISRYRSVGISIVKSLGDHWSAAAETGVSSSEYSNLNIGSSMHGGIEYNIFPYSESSRRIFRLQYWISAAYYDYDEETIYFKTTEWLGKERTSASLKLIQPWGDVTSQISYSHYFHDLGKYRVWLWNQLSLNVVTGLSINISGQIQKVNDQLTLRRAGATVEEVLLQRQELETDYTYWLNFGISYTFGSIYNNIVNPRMW